jgi:hypothetical protein
MVKIGSVDQYKDDRRQKTEVGSDTEPTLTKRIPSRPRSGGHGLRRAQSSRGPHYFRILTSVFRLLTSDLCFLTRDT